MRILRFNITARLLHWSHAVFFIWLLITGIQIFLTSSSLLGNPLIRMIHLYASIPFVLLPCIIYTSGGASDDVKELMAWTEKDLGWLINFLNLKKTSVADKFNGGQKANFFISLLLIIGLSLSGFIVWMKSMFSVDFVELNFLIHDFLSVTAFLLLSGHVIFTLYNIESLYGIIYGWVDVIWVKKHYPKWFAKNP